MSKITERDLLQLKEEVETANTQVIGLRGQETALMKQLKTEFGCKTIDEVEEKIKEKEDELEEIDEKIEKGITELEEKYEFD